MSARIKQSAILETGVKNDAMFVKTARYVGDAMFYKLKQTKRKPAHLFILRIHQHSSSSTFHFSWYVKLFIYTTDLITKSSYHTWLLIVRNDHCLLPPFKFQTHKNVNFHTAAFEFRNVSPQNVISSSLNRPLKFEHSMHYQYTNFHVAAKIIILTQIVHFTFSNIQRNVFYES
jgi:hypothetical protein